MLYSMSSTATERDPGKWNEGTTHYSPLGWHKGAAVDIGFVRTGMMGHCNKWFVSMGTLLHRG